MRKDDRKTFAWHNGFKLLQVRQPKEWWLTVLRNVNLHSTLQAGSVHSALAEYNLKLLADSVIAPPTTIYKYFMKWKCHKSNF